MLDDGQENNVGNMHNGDASKDDDGRPLPPQVLQSTTIGQDLSNLNEF